jgi:uncharacterized protein
MSARDADRLPKPVPTMTADSEPFWTGTAKGELRFQQCDDCGHVQFPFLPACQTCLSDSLTTRRSSGAGSIFSFTTVYRAPTSHFDADVPYTLAMIELDEGFRMFSALTEPCDRDDMVGARVEVRFIDRRGSMTLPTFEIVGE